jgi:hypothetical protein
VDNGAGLEDGADEDRRDVGEGIGTELDKAADCAGPDPVSEPELLQK